MIALPNTIAQGKAKESNPQRERVAVGSIKSNIGHLKAVAGCAGMLKVILALKHKTIPASINVKEPPKLKDSTAIQARPMHLSRISNASPTYLSRTTHAPPTDTQDSALFINTHMRPWFAPPGLPRRAGVSSFGFGGANYHCVLDRHH